MYFPWNKNRQAYFFSMKIKMMDLLMQIESTKLIFVMNFSVLHFLKFASRMLQTAQILVLAFNIFQGGGRGGGKEGWHARGPPWKCPPFFFISSSRLWFNHSVKMGQLIHRKKFL